MIPKVVRESCQNLVVNKSFSLIQKLPLQKENGYFEDLGCAKKLWRCRK